MTTSRWRIWYRQIRGLKWLSPGSFILCEIMCAGVFAALHLAGWRAQTAVLCGTLPAGRTAQTIVGFEAVMYTLFYMAAVIASPILAIAGAVLHLLSRWERRRRSQPVQPGSAGA